MVKSKNTKCGVLGQIGGFRMNVDFIKMDGCGKCNI